MMEEFRCAEEISENGMTYTARWYCEPPPPGARFAVVRSEWNADCTVRVIREIEVLTPWLAES